MGMRFQDRICLVTGGGSGIGKASCERFAREGGKVVVVDLNPDHGNGTVQAIRTAGGEARTWRQWRRPIRTRPWRKRLSRRSMLRGTSAGQAVRQRSA